MTKRHPWVFWWRPKGSTAEWRGSTEPPKRLDPRKFEITITAGGPPSTDLAFSSPEAQLIAEAISQAGGRPSSALAIDCALRRLRGIKC
jgi:hypothetical protein